MDIVNDVSQWNFAKGGDMIHQWWVSEVCGAAIAIAFIYFFSRYGR